MPSSPSVCDMDIDDEEDSPLPHEAPVLVSKNEGAPLTPAIEDSEEDLNMASSPQILPGCVVPTTYS